MGESAATTVAVKIDAIHHPRKVLLVGAFGCLRSKLITHVATAPHYSRSGCGHLCPNGCFRGSTGRCPAMGQTTNSSIWSPFTREGICGKVAGAALRR